MSLTSPAFISANEALTRIQGLTGSNATIQGVVDIINRINPFAPNATSTIGYAGGLNGTPMYEIVKSYARSHPEFAIIDNTPIYDLLKREAFQVELQRIINEVNATNPNPATRLTFSEVYEGKNASGIRVNNTSMWDVGSSHFMENAVGNVKIFAPFGDTNSVLYSTEVPKLFNTPGVTSINGVPIDIIKTAWNAGNTELAINIIKASSVGEIGSLSAAELGSVLNGAAMLGRDSRYFGLMHDIIGSNVGAVFSSPIVQKLGAAGLFIDFSISSYSAIEKYNAGDTAGAIYTMEEWAAKTSGIIGGGIVGMAGAQSLAAVILYGIAATTGVVIVPGMIITAFVVSVGVMSAYYGADLGKWLLDKGIELELYTQKMIDDFVRDARAWWAEHALEIDLISHDLVVAYNKFIDAVKASLHIDPLVIDMAGNGIALNSWQNSGVLFDLNGDGVKEKSGWTKANGDDAFLVIDKNSNGNIDNITEMFGNANTAGFTDLKSYDSNGDNIINASDSQFGLLRLWNDKNSNGRVDTGELTTLAQNNITSISLNAYGNPASIEGNIQIASSDVTFSNGTTKAIHELAFGFQNTNTITTNPDANLPAGFQINIASLMMPYSRGYNSLHSWQVAMTLDPVLLKMAQDIMVTTPVDAANDNIPYATIRNCA